MPIARSLYGNLRDQINDEQSFANHIRKIIELRKEYHIDRAEQVDIPLVFAKSMLAMVHRLEDERIEVTVLNFANDYVSGSVFSSHLPPGAKITDLFTSHCIGYC